MTSDGVFALDGQTGEELWRYARTGAWFRSHGMTPDGEILAVSFYEGDSDDHAQDSEPVETVLLFDVRDGSITEEYEFVPPDGGDGHADRPLNHLTEDAFVVPRLDGSLLRAQAYGLRDGRPTWSAEHDVGAEEIVETLVVGQVLVVVGTRFDDPDDGELGTVSATGFAAEDGSFLWEEERPFLDLALEPGDPLELGATGDGLVSLRLMTPEVDWESWIFDADSGETVLEEPGRLVEGTADGTVLAAPDSERVRYTWFAGDGEEATAVADPRPAELDAAPAVATSAGVLRLDHLLPGGSERGPTTLEVLAWGAENDPDSVPLGFDTHERMKPEEASLFPGRLTPEMTLVPGALVVSEAKVNSTELRGVA